LPNCPADLRDRVTLESHALVMEISTGVHTAGGRAVTKLAEVRGRLARAIALRLARWEAHLRERRWPSSPMTSKPWSGCGSRTCARRPRKRIRSTKLLERTFVEVRCRINVIRRFPRRNSILSTIWAALELTSHGWRGVVMTLAPWPIQNGAAVAAQRRR